MENYASAPNFASYPQVDTVSNLNAQISPYEHFSRQDYILSSTGTSITSTPLSTSTSPYSSQIKPNSLPQMTSMPYESLHSTFNTNVTFSNGFTSFYQDPQSFDAQSFVYNQASLESNQTPAFLNRENQSGQIDFTQSEYKSNSNAYFQRASNDPTAMTSTNGQITESIPSPENTAYYTNQTEHYYQSNRQYYSNPYQTSNWPSYTNPAQSYYTNNQTYSTSKQTYYTQFDYNQQNTFSTNNWMDTSLYPVNPSSSNTYAPKSQEYSAMTAKTSESLDQETIQTTNQSVSDGYFNNNYFKMTNKSKSKKSLHSSNNSGTNYKVKQSCSVKRKAYEDAKRGISQLNYSKLLLKYKIWARILKKFGYLLRFWNDYVK